MSLVSLLNPQDVGIIISYRCHSGCAHCLYNCGPRWEKAAMSPEVLHQALEVVTRFPQRPQVHLTGGEPFLYADLLLEGARMAAELGITAYVETNGSWCTDEGEAVARFTALRKAGLQFVLVSCSPFHAESIPPQRTLRTIRAALDAFGSQRVIVYLSQFLDVIQYFGLERPTPLSRYEEEFGRMEAARILWQGYGLISGGRSGYRLGHLVLSRPAEAFVQTNCASEILYAPHSHFDLYGNYIQSFCGGLTVGGWHDLPQVRTAYAAGRYPPLIEILIERGPYGLFELAQERFGYGSQPNGYVGKCHLCVDVRRYLVEAGDFVELQPQGFYEHL
jgi:hypothetical protein